MSLALALMLALPAQTAPVDEGAWLERSRQIIEAPNGGLDPEFVEQARAPDGVASGERAGRSLLRQAELVEREQLEESGAMEPEADATYVGWKLFVSQSMGEAGLREAMEIVREHPGAVLVLRGLAPKQKITDLQRLLMNLAGSVDTFPAVQIDPPAFARHGVATVPTWVVENERGLAKVAVSGLLTPAWLARQLKSGAVGDLGARGPTLEILEPDLMEAFKASVAANFDSAAVQKSAGKRYLAEHAIAGLARAQAPRRREIDPSFEVTENITDLNGTVLVLAGERINPLARGVPFTQRLVVFDPTDDAQLAFAKAALGNGDGRRITLIATRFADDATLDDVARLGSAVGSAVSLLTEEVRSRFAIEALPTTIEARGERFIVDEHLMRGP